MKYYFDFVQRALGFQNDNVENIFLIDQNCLEIRIKNDGFISFYSFSIKDHALKITYISEFINEPSYINNAIEQHRQNEKIFSIFEKNGVLLETRFNFTFYQKQEFFHEKNKDKIPEHLYMEISANEHLYKDETNNDKNTIEICKSTFYYFKNKYFINFLETSKLEWLLHQHTDKSDYHLEDIQFMLENIKDVDDKKIENLISCIELNDNGCLTDNSKELISVNFKV